MKSLYITIFVLFLLIASPFTLVAIDRFCSTDYTQSVAGVTTGAGAYSANVTLSQTLYKGHVAQVAEIASNITSDTPSADVYSSLTEYLTVAGLAPSQDRTLTIEYYIDSASLPDGTVGIISTLLIWFWIFLIIGSEVGAIYAFFTS